MKTVAKHVLMVLTNAKDGQEEEFNSWYTEVHLKDVLKVDGFVAAQRFEQADQQLGEKGPHRYLAIYEVETEDLQQTLKQLSETNMVISDGMDAEGVAAWAFSPITERMVS